MFLQCRKRNPLIKIFYKLFLKLDLLGFLKCRVKPRPGPLTTPKDPPSEQRLHMPIPPLPMNLVGHTGNETCSYPNGGTHQHDVLTGVEGPVETELDASTVGKNKNDDLAPASPLREDTLFLSPTHSTSSELGSCTEPKETENATSSSRSANQCLENGTVVKPPKQMFSRGFLDRPYRMKPLEKNRRAHLPGIDQNPDLNTNCFSDRLCNGHLPNGDASTSRNGQIGLVGKPFSNGESSIKEEDSSGSTGGCTGNDMDNSSFSTSNGSLKEGELSSINDGIDRMDVSNSYLNGNVSKSNGYSALEIDNKNEVGIDCEMHEMVLSQEDGPTQNGLRHRVVHSQPVFKAAEQNGVAEL